MSFNKNERYSEFNKSGEYLSRNTDTKDLLENMCIDKQSMYVSLSVLGYFFLHWFLSED